MVASVEAFSPSDSYVCAVFILIDAAHCEKLGIHSFVFIILLNDVCLYAKTCRSFRVHCRDTKNVSCSTKTYPGILFKCAKKL